MTRMSAMCNELSAYYLRKQIFLKRQIQLKRPWRRSTPLWHSIYVFRLQWWEAQRSWPNLSHQWPAPGPDGDPPAGYRHSAVRFREGDAHGGKGADTSAGQSSRVPHTLCCQYAVSQLQRGMNDSSKVPTKSQMKTFASTPTCFFSITTYPYT